MPRAPHRPGQQVVGLRVTDEPLGGRVPFELAIQPDCNFRNQPEIRSLVAGFDRSYRIAASSNATKKISMVAAGLAKVGLVRLNLHLQQRRRLSRNPSSVDMDPALVTFEPATLFVRIAGVCISHAQATGIVELSLPVVDIVGHAVVAIAAPALELERLSGELRAAPICDVQMMDAPVDDKAGTVISDEVPVRPGQSAAVVRFHRRRTDIHIIIKSCRDRFRRGRFVICPLILRPGRGDLDCVNPADISVPRKLTGEPEFAV